jgi:hypothetical protein
LIARRGQTAVNVAGRKKIVIAAMIRMTALSLEVAIATSCEVSASLVLVVARDKLFALSRCAMPEYTYRDVSPDFMLATIGSSSAIE